MAEILDRIDRRPRDLLEFYELGHLCGVVEDGKLWLRGAPCMNPGGRCSERFSEYLAGRCPYSRQKIGRILRVARIFSSETLGACHAAGVGMRIMAELAGADVHYRRILVGLAMERVPLSSLRRLRRGADKCLRGLPAGLKMEQIRRKLAAAIHTGVEELRTPRTDPGGWRCRSLDHDRVA